MPIRRCTLKARFTEARLLPSEYRLECNRHRVFVPCRKKISRLPRRQRENSSRTYAEGTKRTSESNNRVKLDDECTANEVLTDTERIAKKNAIYRDVRIFLTRRVNILFDKVTDVISDGNRQRISNNREKGFQLIFYKSSKFTKIIYA